MATRLARRLAVLAALLWGAAAFAQAPESTASWKVSQKAVSDDEFELIFTASIEPGWHIYQILFDALPGNVTVHPVPPYLRPGLLWRFTEYICKASGLRMQSGTQGQKGRKQDGKPAHRLTGRLDKGFEQSQPAVIYTNHPSTVILAM